MNYFIDITDEKRPQKIDILGGVSFSTGDGLETKSRYGYDFSRKSTALVYRRRNTAFTATLQLAFNPYMCAENGVGIMDYVSTLDGLVGRRVRLIWNDREHGPFIVSGSQVSATVDSVDVFSVVSVSLEMTEGYIRRETAIGKVSVMGG